MLEFKLGCYTYGPAAGTWINRALLCCLLHHHLGRGNTQHLLVGTRTAGSGHRQLARQVGVLRDIFSLVPI